MTAIRVITDFLLSMSILVVATTIIPTEVMTAYCGIEKHRALEWNFLFWHFVFITIAAGMYAIRA